MPSEPREAFVLNRPQKFCLQIRSERRDVIEVDRSALSHLELSDLARDGVGERSLLESEQLRFEKIGRDGGAIDADERFFAADSALVDRLREMIFADAGLAEEEDVDVVVED